MEIKSTTNLKFSIIAKLLVISLFFFCNKNFAQKVQEIVFKKPSEVKLDTLFFDFSNGELSKTVNFKNESGIIGTGNKNQIWKYDASKFNIICNNKAWNNIGDDYKGELPFNNDLPLFKIFFSPDFKTDRIETIHFYTDNQNKVDTVYSAIFSYPYLKLSSDKLQFRLDITKDSLLNSTIEVQNIGLDTLIIRGNTKSNSDLISFSQSNYTVFPQSSLDIPIQVSIPGSINFDGNDSIRKEASLIVLNTQFPKNRFEKKVVVDIIKSNTGTIIFNLGLPDILKIIFALIFVFILFLLFRIYKKSTIFFILRLNKYLKNHKNEDEYLLCLNKAASNFLPIKKKISNTKIKYFIQECINYSNGAILKEEDVNKILKESNQNYQNANSIFKEIKDSFLSNISSKSKVTPNNRLKNILNKFLKESVSGIFNDFLQNKTIHNSIENLGYNETIDKINNVFEEDAAELNTYKQILNDAKKKFSIVDDANAVKLINDSIEICFATDSINKNLKRQKDTSHIVNALNEDKELVEIVSNKIGFDGERSGLISSIKNWFDENRKLTELLNYSKKHFNISNTDSILSILNNAVNTCLKVKKGKIGSLLSSGKDDNFCVEMLQKDTLILQNSFTILKDNNFYEIKSDQSQEDLPDIIPSILKKIEDLESKLNSKLPTKDVFKQVLLQLGDCIKEIIKIRDWDRKFSSIFLRHFENTNNEIDKILHIMSNTQDIIALKDKIPLESLKLTLNELFRLHAFSISDCKYFVDELKKVEFPFEEYNANILMLKGIILKVYNTNLIVPNVFKDKFDETVHENYTGPYIALKSAPTSIFENLKFLTVVDIHSIGYESKINGINKKPKVYVRSK